MRVSIRHGVLIVLAFVLHTVVRSQEEAGQPELKAYTNYDFVPGEKILFEDDFVNDLNGEFVKK